jgi:hypothetical protein
MELLLRFWCLEILPVHLYTQVKPFIICFHPPLLDYDVSMDKVVELVVVIPTSRSSSKMESGYKSYHRFRVDVFFSGKFGPRPEKSGGAPNHVTEQLFGDRQTGRWTVRPEIRRCQIYGQTSSWAASNGQISPPM